MKKLVGSLSIIFLFLMFACGSGPETADEQEVHEEIEMIEDEVYDQEVKERTIKEEAEVRERSVAGDKDQAAEKKPVERIRIDPEEEKEQPELQQQKEDEPELQIESP